MTLREMWTEFRRGCSNGPAGRCWPCVWALLRAAVGHVTGSTARRRIEELERSFDLRWSADMRAIKRWQAMTGRTLTWPDHADLVVWLLERLEKHDGRSS